MSVTIKELARQLDLDHSTVGYALSGKGTIKEETRRRVCDKARELGYVANAHARRMRSTKTMTLGLVVPDVVLVYSELVQHLFRGAMARGYELQIALTEFRDELEDRAIQSLLEARVDGIILKTKYGAWDEVPPRHALRRAVESEVPIVSYGFEVPGSGLPWMPLPVSEGCALLVEHLVEQGHRDFAWLFPLDEFTRAQHYRLEGTREALARHDLTLPDARVLSLSRAEADAVPPGDYHNYLSQALPRLGVPRGRLLAERALQLSPRPTALLCQNEATAIGAMQVLAERGIVIGYEIAVAATDHSLVSELAPIPLTTVDVQTSEAAEATLALLWNRMELEKTQTPLPQPHLRVAASTLRANGQTQTNQLAPGKL